MGFTANCPLSGKAECEVPDDVTGARVDEGEPDTPKTKSRPRHFGSEEKLSDHYRKHGAEFGAMNKEDYLQVSRDVVDQGTRVEYKYDGEIREGYLMLVGNNRKGESKFAFVGTNNKQEITTLHVKRGKDLWKMLNGDARDNVLRPAK